MTLSKYNGDFDNDYEPDQFELGLNDCFYLTENAQESQRFLAALTSTRVQREAQEELEDPITTPFSKEMKFQGQELDGRLTSQVDTKLVD